MMSNFRGMLIYEGPYLEREMICIPECMKDHSFEEKRYQHYLPEFIKKDAIEKKKAGDILHEAGNYSSALELYSEAIGLCPGNAVYFCNRSQILIELGYYRTGLVDAQHAVTLDSTFKYGYDCIIRCYICLGNITDAKEAITKCKQMNSNNDNCKQYEEQCLQLESFDVMVKQCIEKKDFDEAVHNIDSFLQIAVACLKLKCLKAECLMKLGRYDEANEIVDSCMKTDPLNINVIYVAGLRSYNDGDIDKSLINFGQAQRLVQNKDGAQQIQLTAYHLKEEKQKADEAFKIGNFHEAHDIYTGALQIDPKNVNFNAKLYSCRAKCHNHMENYEQCIKDYEIALKMDTTTNGAIKQAYNKTKTTWKQLAKDAMNAGDEHYKNGNHSISLTLYNKAIKLCSDNAAYYRQRSNCLATMYDYKNALKDGQKSVAIDNESDKGYECIIKCCLHLGNIDGALAAIVEFSKISSNDDVCKQFEGQLKMLRSSTEMAMEHFEHKRFEEALFAFNDALGIATASKELKLLKVECLIRTRHIDRPFRINEAKEIVNLCIEFDPLSDNAFYMAAQCSYYDGELDKCLEYFGKALDLNPGHYEARNMRLEAFRIHEIKKICETLEIVEARKMFEQALEINPLNEIMNATIYFDRAQNESKMGFFNNAVADCKRALDLNSNYIEALLLRAKCHNEMKNFKDCINDYVAALKIQRTSEVERELEQAKNSLHLSEQEKILEIQSILSKI